MNQNVNGEGGPQYPAEILNTFTAGTTLLCHKPTMKVGFPIMLSRDIDPFKGHVNVARYKVKAVYTNLLMIDSLTGDLASKIFALPTMPCGPHDGTLL